MGGHLRRAVKLLKAVSLTAVGALIGWMLCRWQFRSPAVSETDAGLGLQTLVGQLRSELERMEEDRQSHERGALFEVKNFDLELSFVIKKSEKNKAEFETELATIGTERELGRENTDKITLHMELVPPESVVIHPAAVPVTGPDIVVLPPVRRARERK